MRAVIDTNVLVYDTFEDSVFHREAKQLLDDLEKWVIPTMVVHEYVWVLKSLKVEAKDVLYKVEEYLDHHKTKLVSESRKHVLSALRNVVEGGISLSRYNDEVILSVATEMGAALATFDERLRKRAKLRGVRVIP